MTAIVATWTCGGAAGDALCTLWGVDVAGAGQWTDKSRFVIEGPESVVPATYEEACKGGRCSSPEYSVCSIPVTRSGQTPIAVLLRSGS
ncbi:hypothetical protein [Pandoraea captiosa]|uniref:hypothetical protein n=1 Tax=Pandoraea captiosa TaxID=2508302 RepID=UPI00124067EB|nr:hypothetical protein [Pandoraea captiosa]